MNVYDKNNIFKMRFYCYNLTKYISMSLFCLKFI